MSNASLKDQLAAVASQLSDKKEIALKRKFSKKDPQQKVFKPAKPKPKWLDYAQYGVELLKAYFPACFKSPNEIKPLKKGIKQDLVKHLSTLNQIVIEDKACMVKSLAYYVNTISYYKSMHTGVARVDLEGNNVGEVTAEEAAYAEERCKAKLHSKQQNRHKNSAKA